MHKQTFESNFSEPLITTGGKPEGKNEDSYSRNHLKTITQQQNTRKDAAHWR